MTLTCPFPFLVCHFSPGPIAPTPNPSISPLPSLRFSALTPRRTPLAECSPKPSTRLSVPPPGKSHPHPPKQNPSSPPCSASQERPTDGANPPALQARSQRFLVRHSAQKSRHRRQRHFRLWLGIRGHRPSQSSRRLRGQGPLLRTHAR